MLLRVKSIALRNVKVATMEVGMAREAITTERTFADEEEHHQAGQEAAEEQVLFQGGDGGVDEDRLVPDDAQGHVREAGSSGSARAGA